MSIRLRIVLLVTGLMALLVVALSGGVYFTLERSLRHDVDARLRNVYLSYKRDPNLQTTQVADGLVMARIPDIDPFTSPGLYIQVVRLNGQVVDRAPKPAGPIAVPPDVLQRTASGSVVIYTDARGGTPVRILSGPLFDTQTGAIFAALQVVEPLTPLHHTLDKFRDFIELGAGIALLVTAAGAWLLTDRSLRPLAEITTTAQAIGSSGDLSRRITPPGTDDEVQQLAETFNEMLSRLEDAFSAERRFVSDASHELRTPLTALRGNAEILLRQIEAGRIEPDDLKEGLADMRDEAERMGRLVQNLLTLARADVGWRPELAPIQIDQVASDAARVAAPLARNHRFTVRIDDEVDALGNADQLKQLLLILLDNAFAYTPPGGDVALAVRRVDGGAELVVQDSGPGIPAEQLERIFDRFYRGESARVRRADGAGLGLAIARWIVECHGGSIHAESQPGAGTRIVVRVPSYPAAAETAEHRAIGRAPRAAVAVAQQ
ncbi:MAG: HAMP domain-containing protein [Thermomicrobiaceae bacterium]|nr:HAMP domain-containing protein [Thermomicrobiaceae bacterium]